MGFVFEDAFGAFPEVRPEEKVICMSPTGSSLAFLERPAEAASDRPRAARIFCRSASRLLILRSAVLTDLRDETLSLSDESEPM